MRLTVEQRAHYECHGYVLIEGGLHAADLAPVIAAYETFIDTQARRLHDAGTVSQLFEEEPFDRRLVCLCEEDASIYDHIDLMYCRLRGVFEFLRNPRLLDLVEGVVGPEIICSPIQHVRAKLPSDLARGRNSHVAPWHQDAQVHTEEADPHFILTVWIPLCDATPENGCLRIIPRVHRGETVYWSEGFGISEENMPEGEVLTVPMKKGSVLLLDKLTPHGSGPNATDGIRWSMDLRYQKAGTPTGRSCYPDFAVLSRAAPSSVLTEFATWDRLWLEALEEYPQKVGRKTRPDGPAPDKAAIRRP